MSRRSNTSWEKRKQVPFHANHLTDDASWYFTQFELDDAWKSENIEKSLEAIQDVHENNRDIENGGCNIIGSVGYIFADAVASDEWTVTDYKMKKDLQCVHTRSVADIVKELDGVHDHLVLFIDNPKGVTLKTEKSTLHYWNGVCGDQDNSTITYTPEVKK